MTEKLANDVVLIEVVIQDGMQCLTRIDSPRQQAQRNGDDCEDEKCFPGFHVFGPL